MVPALCANAPSAKHAKPPIEKLILNMERAKNRSTIAHLSHRTLNEGGVPPQTLLKMGRWSDINTVQNFYLKNSDANEKMAVEVLDRLMGSSKPTDANKDRARQVLDELMGK